MLDAVDEVEGEGEGQGELDSALDDKRQSSEARSQSSALDVEAEKRRGEVGGEVDVGGAGQSAAGDTSPGRGAEPGLFHLVDAQVRRDGSLETLLDEDLLALFGGELLSRDGSVKNMSIVLAKFSLLLLLLWFFVEGLRFDCLRAAESVGLVWHCLPDLRSRHGRGENHARDVLAEESVGLSRA
jgi:hypothetical protein